MSLGKNLGRIIQITPLCFYALFSTRMAYLLFVKAKIGAVAVQDLFSLPSSILVELGESFIPGAIQYRDLRVEFVCVVFLGAIQYLIVGLILKRIFISLSNR